MFQWKTLFLRKILAFWGLFWGQCVDFQNYDPKKSNGFGSCKNHVCPKNQALFSHFIGLVNLPHSRQTSQNLWAVIGPWLNSAMPNSSVPNYGLFESMKMTVCNFGRIVVRFILNRGLFQDFLFSLIIGGLFMGPERALPRNTVMFYCT